MERNRIVGRMMINSIRYGSVFRISPCGDINVTVNWQAIQRKLDGMNSSSGITIREGDRGIHALDPDSPAAGSGREC
jgi:hypothetical protein